VPFSIGPEPASYDPEEFVDGSQPWPRLLALKDGELLAKGEVFEHQTAARPQPAKHGSEPEPKQVKHGNKVIADRLCRLPCEVVDFTAGQDCDEAQAWGCGKRSAFPTSPHPRRRLRTNFKRGATLTIYLVQNPGQLSIDCQSSWLLG